MLSGRMRGLKTLIIKTELLKNDIEDAFNNAWSESNVECENMYYIFKQIDRIKRKLQSMEETDVQID